MSAQRVFLLTGATTELGQHVARRLARLGRVIGARAPNEPPSPAGADDAHVADLTRADEVRRVLLGVAAAAHVDTIVHLGTPSGSGHRAPAPNTLATRLLLDTAERLGSLRSFVLRSTAALYRVDAAAGALLDEQQPLDLGPREPRLRDWLEADLAADQRMVASRLRIAVLRLSELMIADEQSLLHQYLQQRLALRPMGFNPMINVLSADDAADALARAAESSPRGVFNIPGADTLPLSELLHALGRPSLAVPDPLLGVLAALRSSAPASSSALRARFHFGSGLDGRAAAGAFGYTPKHPLY